MGGVLLRVSVYIKVQTGRGQRAREHVTAEKAADSNCDILFLWGRNSNLVIVSSSSLSLFLSVALFSVENGSAKVALTPQTIVKLISV